MRLNLCEHLGGRIDKAGCNCPRKDGYVCTAGHGVVRPIEQCEKCPDYVSDSDGTTAISDSSTRHLLYHMYPVRANRACWEWNVSEIRKREKLFNGVKLVYISVDGMTEPIDTIRAAFGAEYEVREMKNQPNLAETQSWIHAWSTVLQNLSGRVFYAHAKGVSHSFDLTSSVSRWTRVMYETNLDYYGVVDEVLRGHPTAGSLCIRGLSFPGTTFHYSGTFFWSDIEKVREKVFQIPFLRWGVEAWAGKNFPIPGVVFYEAPAMNLYAPAMMDRIEYALNLWKDRNRLNTTELP